MKIRIGNDIKLEMQLIFGDTSSANILSAQAFFVNTTLKEKLQKEYNQKNRFFGRFPIEPFTNEFEPNAYCINSTGFPKYRAFAVNMYNGIGYKPNWNKVAPIKEEDYTVYRSEIEYTSEPEFVKVTFPAVAQLYTGKYELIIVARVFDAGYKNNERIVTANYKNVFELISDSQECVNNPVQISISNLPVDEVQPENPEVNVNDIYVTSGRYNDNYIKLSRNGASTIDIDVSAITDWYNGN